MPAAILWRCFSPAPQNSGDKPFLWAKREGKWQSLTWTEAARQVCLVAEALRGLGLKRGRPRDAGLGKPPRMVHRRSRDHGGRLHHRARLHHQYRARPTPMCSKTRARVRCLSPTPSSPKHLLPAILRSDVSEHVIAFEPLRQMQAGTTAMHDWAELLAGDAVAARAGCRRADRRDQAARTWPASSTPAAPADPRAGLCSITA